MPKAKYFFINKDAASDSLTRSSGLQRSAIQKHVQRGLVQNGSLYCQKAKPAPFKEEPTLDDKALYNPSIRSLSCKFDAFNGTSVYIDRTVRVLIDYYIYYYHPTIWTCQPLAPSPQPYAFQSSVTQVVRTALQDPLAMYCLLSAAAARVSNVDGLPFPGSPAKQDYFMQEALCLMQGRINETDVGVTGATDRLVSCMMFLCSAEAYRGNYDAAWTHLKIALKILEPNGGVMTVEDKNLQGQLLMSDLALSCINLEPCLCPCDFYDPGPASTLDLTDEEFSPVDCEILGSKFLRRGTDSLPLKLKALICAILDSYVAKSGLKTTHMSPSRAFETTHWVQKRNMAIRNRLLAFKTSDGKVHALRTALIMWTLLSMNITGRVMTVKVMATKLRSILDDIPTRAWKENNNEDVRLWILLVGHSCASERGETYAWFSEQVRRMLLCKSNVCGTGSGRNGLLQGLIDFQQGFLYHDPVQKCRMEELAEWLSWWEGMVFN